MKTTEESRELKKVDRQLEAEGFSLKVSQKGDCFVFDSFNGDLVTRQKDIEALKAYLQSPGSLYSF